MKYMLEELILLQADIIEQLCYLLAIASIFAYLTQEECYERIVDTIAFSLIALLVLITITTFVFIFFLTKVFSILQMTNLQPQSNLNEPLFFSSLIFYLKYSR